MDLKKIVDEANKDFKLAESELKIYLSTETVEDEKLQKMKEAYEQAARDLEHKQEQQSQLESTVPSNESELREVQNKLQTLKTQEATVAREARALRAQLEESRQAMNANRSRGRVLDALMKEKSKGNIPGIFGRLGDLGGIDQKYDVAISTCCGALDNIVVDTVETAQACVAHLKRHDIGRATFIALDKQDHLWQYVDQRGRYPENVPRLFDLVKVRDDRVRPAFYYALRDTLVANDLDQASRIAYGSTRYRVVTLKGDVIEIAVNVPRLFDLVKVRDDRVRPAFYYALRDTLVANDLDQASRIAYGSTRYRVVTLKGDVIEIAVNVPRLFDLVKVRDDRVRPAFYYALRDTLVANDLDQASRIAYGSTRYRVVTLKGDVIEIAVNVPRLFDLVKVRDDRVRPAFYYALRDTLVANDLDQASRIAYGSTRYRVVTLKGDVIEIAVNVPRLFDLVKVRDDRVRPAFYYALRDTLVANDLDQASRIAYGSTRYRVVTLKGDVIEIAGTMSGGGKSTMRGRMSSSVQQDTSEQDPRVIQENERQLNALEQRLTELRSEQVALEDQMASLQRSTREGKTTLHKLNVELRSLREQVPVLENQIQQQEHKVSTCKVDPRRKADLEKAMKTAQEKLDKAKHDAGEVAKEVHGVDAQISAVAGGKVKDLQKMVEDLSKKIDKISTEITKLRVAINTSIRNAKKSKDKINQMETDLKETEKALTNLTNQKKELTLETQKLQKEMEELEEQISEGSGEFTDLKKEIAALQKKENEIKSERLEANNAVEKVAKKISEAKGNIRTWEHNCNLVSLQKKENLEANNAVEKVAKKISEAKGNIRTWEHNKEIAALQKKENEIKSERLEANNAVEKVAKKISEAKGNIRTWEHNLQKKENEIKSERLEANNAVEKVAKKISEAKGNIRTWEHNKEIAALQKKENEIKSERLEANNAVEKVAKKISEAKGNIRTWEHNIKDLKLEDPGIDGVPGIERPEPFEVYTPEQLEEVSVDELRNRLQAQKARVGDAKPNVQAILRPEPFEVYTPEQLEEVSVDELRNRLQAQKARVGDAKPNVQAILLASAVWPLKLEDPGIDGVPGIERPEPFEVYTPEQLEEVSVDELRNSISSEVYTPEQLEEVSVDELRNRLQAQKARVGDAKPNVQAILPLKLEDPGIERPEPFEVYTPEQLEEVSVDELRNRLQAQKARVGDAKPNVQAILPLKLEDPGIERPEPFEVYTPEQLEEVSVDELRNRLQAQKARVGDAKPNVQAILVNGVPGIERPEPFEVYTPEQLEEVSVDELRNRLQAQKARVGDAKPNVQAILVYTPEQLEEVSVDELRNRLQAQKARVGDAKPNVQAILRPEPFEVYTPEQLEEVSVDELRNRLQAQKARVGDAKPNVQAILPLKLEDPGIERPEPFEVYTPEQLEEVSVDELRNRLQAQKARVGDAKPNVQAILVSRLMLF
ncbi:SMC proteins flexible hinge domain-containing protein [Phthorimaea operculella]|nr:SMC proteins flexible hinge domain-containing protein [Phthorimaea operculella]